MCKNKLFLYYFSEIGQAFNMLGKDPDCRVIILSGNGKAFCSGIDLSDLMELGNVVNSDEDTARKSMMMLNVIKTFQSYFMAMEKVRKTICSKSLSFCINLDHIGKVDGTRKGPAC